MPRVSIALPDPWIMVDVDDLTDDQLAALPAGAGEVRKLLAATATQLADRAVGFLALRVSPSGDGPQPTGLITMTLDRSDAADLENVAARVKREFAAVDYRMLGDDRYVVGVSTGSDERAFVRGDFRLVADGLLLTVWSTIVVLEDGESEQQVVDAIVTSLRLSMED